MVVSHNRNRQIRKATERDSIRKDRERSRPRYKRGSLRKRKDINPRIIISDKISEEKVYYLTLVIDYANKAVEFLAFKTNLKSIPWPDIALVTKTPFNRRIPLSEIKRTRRKFFTLAVPRSAWLHTDKDEKVELLKKLYPRLMAPNFDERPE